MLVNYWIIPGLTEFVSIEKLPNDHIVGVVAKVYAIEPEMLFVKIRSRSIVEPRQICMYILCKFKKLRLKEIGDFFGGYDHTTVIHSCNTVTNMLDTDPEYISRFEKVLEACKSIPE